MLPLRTAPPQPEAPIRVMVVDDSAVVRGLIGRWLAEDGFEVVGSFRNGKEAVDAVGRALPDVVLLDVEMPEMDGLTALPLILERRPGVQVIMASTLTRRNAEVTLRALSRGAGDCIPKPEAKSRLGNAADFRREVVEKARALGARARRYRTPQSVPPVAARRAVVRPSEPAPAPLRSFSTVLPKVIAVGSSTGGPQALAEMLRGIGPHVAGLPVLVTQHMPPTFTAILAEHLARAAKRPAREAEDGERVAAGTIYIAPGGRHMRVRRQGAEIVIGLDDGPPVNFCKPAVDPLFASVAEVYGPAALAVVLTGMGHDGTAGGAAIASAGGSVVAQDEATSVVWGMPGAAARAGICSAVLPLVAIAPKLVALIEGARA